MTELFTDTVLNMMTTTAEPEDYTGEDGLLFRLRQVPHGERSLLSQRNRRMVGA